MLSDIEHQKWHPEIRVQAFGQVAVLTINRPESRNAIGLGTIDDLEAALDEIVQTDAQVLVITGAGDRAFVSGGDLKELAGIRDRDGAREMAIRMRRVLDRIADYEIPVIAAINGHALGGGAEVAIAADIRIAAADIRIGFNQTRLSIIPAWGGIERLVSTIGRGGALMLIASGEILTAPTARHLGLLDIVVDRAEFEDAWMELAQTFANLPPLAGRSIKTLATASWPKSHKELEESAVSEFAEFWIADDHWRSVEAIRTRGTETARVPLWLQSINKDSQ